MNNMTEEPGPMDWWYILQAWLKPRFTSLASTASNVCKLFVSNLGNTIAVIASIAAVWTGVEADMARTDARKTMQLDERPFVVVTSGRWVPYDLTYLNSNVSRPFSLDVKATITHFGRTPALKISVNSSCAVFGNSAVIPPLPGPIPYEKNIHETPLGAGESTEIGRTTPILTSGQSFVANCRTLIYTEMSVKMTGTILYEDIFNQFHTSTFCIENEEDIAPGRPVLMYSCPGFEPAMRDFENIAAINSKPFMRSAITKTASPFSKSKVRTPPTLLQTTPETTTGTDDCERAQKERREEPDDWIPEGYGCQLNLVEQEQAIEEEERQKKATHK